MFFYVYLRNLVRNGGKFSSTEQYLTLKVSSTSAVLEFLTNFLKYKFLWHFMQPKSALSYPYQYQPF